MRYRIPIRLHGKGAGTKARISFYVQHEGVDAQPTYLPGASTRIVTVEAANDDEAVQRLCQAVRPTDLRPILSTYAIGRFRQEGS